MGLEFIEGKRKTFERAWNGGVTSFKLPDLFSVHFDEQCRALSLALDAHVHLAVGDMLVVELVRVQLVASRSMQHIGVVEDVPNPVVKAVEQAANVCFARVTRLGEFGGVADIELVLAP